MQKGDIVLIKSALGEPGVRRVWDPAPERPYVCLEDYWTRWQTNQVEPICWQVSKSQIFQVDEKLAIQLEAAFAAQRRGDAQAGALVEKLWSQAKPST